MSHLNVRQFLTSPLGPHGPHHFRFVIRLPHQNDAQWGWMNWIIRTAYINYCWGYQTLKVETIWGSDNCLTLALTNLLISGREDPTRNNKSRLFVFFCYNDIVKVHHEKRSGIWYISFQWPIEAHVSLVKNISRLKVLILNYYPLVKSIKFGWVK